MEEREAEDENQNQGRVEIQIHRARERELLQHRVRVQLLANDRHRFDIIYIATVAFVARVEQPRN